MRYYKQRTPKIELHVHLEGTIRPRALLEIARRNGVRLPADNEDELAQLYQFKDFEHFLELWLMTTCAVQTEADFRQVVVDYAAEAAGHGAVYIEGIFTPAERVAGGASWDEVFTGFCDGAAQAVETYGVEIRLTPDIPRNLGLEVAVETARYAIKYREPRHRRDRTRWPRGVVATRALRTCVPDGQGRRRRIGPPRRRSVRTRVDLGSDRRASRPTESVTGSGPSKTPVCSAQLAERQIVCDVCPVSNVRTRAVDSLDAHPLTQMIEASVHCSISTDDPAMFDTDLLREYQVAAKLGCPPKLAFHAGVMGALCDEQTRAASGPLRRPSRGARSVDTLVIQRGK